MKRTGRGKGRAGPMVAGRRSASGAPSQGRRTSTPARLDVIVPVCNEAPGLERFADDLAAVLREMNYRWRVIFVDDGSTDDTPDLLQSLHFGDPRISWIRLTRNFGYQAALTAGLEQADADVIGTMDGDGEHPPELLPEMLELVEAGYDVVLTVREETGSRSGVRRLPQRLFYRLLNILADTRVVPGVTDFRLLSRRAWLGLMEMRERHRYLRGMVSWMGFKSVIVPFSPEPRKFGQSRWTSARLARLAGEAILSFSLAPLGVGLLVGLLFLLFALVEAFYVVGLWLTGRGGQIAPGWSSLMFVLLIVGSSLMIALAVVGIYAGLTYQEVKRRPVYLIEERSGGIEGNRKGPATRPRRGPPPGSGRKGRR